MESGRLVTIKGSRINGVGVARFLTESGFSLARPENLDAARLADLMDVRQGTALVEKASQDQAQALQSELAGLQCTFVPFGSEQDVVRVKVKQPRGSRIVSFDLREAFGSGSVEIDYVPGAGLGSVQLGSGWLVGPENDASEYPRSTEYGGTVETAVYVICNSGLGRLLGAKHLEMDDDSAVDAPYPRGSLNVTLTNGDTLLVGINHADELEATYLRDGKAMYSRTGMTHPRLGHVIGCIAAVLVRVAEMDAKAAAPSKKAKCAV